MKIFAAVVLSFNFIAFASADGLLRVPKHISEQKALAGLMKKVATPQGSGSRLTSSSFSGIQGSLRPIYDALPKNEHGTLEDVVARYALHRLFVLQHGWVLQSLEPNSGAKNASAVPSFIEDLFAQHTGDKGVNLQELAVLATTVLHLIQEETVHRVARAFAIHEPHDPEHTGKIDHLKAEKLLDTYMVAYILSENLDKVTPDAAQRMVSDMTFRFAHWGETQAFVRAVKKSVVQTSSDQELSMVDQLDFETLVKVAETADEEFGEFLHSSVCKGLKARLVSMEYRNTGRVKLSAFYKGALEEGDWQFQESVPYLKDLGVLDTTDPHDPSVMIANYLLAPTNCIATSGFYSACCRNECEVLLGHLEQKVAAPEATPADIASLIANLPSDTVSAPRTLSPTLLRRLEEIAASHHGTVPLHGRLFTQWMHHAYPRECPYPHVSGSTAPKLPEEWLEASGNDYSASEEEMRKFVQASTDVPGEHVAVEDLMAWTHEEELLVVRPQVVPSEAKKSPSSIVFLAVAGLVAYALVNAMKATSSKSKGMTDKYTV